jgi:hypothetical protein
MDLVETFYLHIYPSFPILPKELFLKYADKFPHFCIASINAFASVYMAKGEDDLSTAQELGEKNSRIARRLLDQHINAPTPIIIYGLLLLGSYYTGMALIFYNKFNLTHSLSVGPILHGVDVYWNGYSNGL